jgi:hypothetical protein
MSLLIYFITCIAILAIIFLWIYKNIPIREEKINIILNFFIQVVIFAGNAYFKYSQSDNIPSDYFEINKPKLEAKLILNKDSSSTTFKYIIKNVGLLPAENIRYMYKAPSTIGQEFNDFNECDIFPRSEILFNPMYKEILTSDTTDFNLFVLLLYYDAYILGELHSYQSTYKFIVEAKNLKSDTLISFTPIVEEKKYEYDDIFEFFNITHKRDTFSYKSFPGLSVNFNIQINSNIKTEKNYICDIVLEGKNIKYLSIFVDSIGALHFEIINNDKVKDSIIIEPFYFKTNKHEYLCCEILNYRNKSYLQVYVNGSYIKRKLLRNYIIINKTITGIVGADLSFMNKGFFKLNKFEIKNRTNNSTERLKRLEGMYNNNLIWQTYNGNRIDTLK